MKASTQIVYASLDPETLATFKTEDGAKKGHPEQDTSAEGSDLDNATEMTVINIAELTLPSDKQNALYFPTVNAALEAGEERALLKLSRASQVDLAALAADEEESALEAAIADPLTRFELDSRIPVRSAI